MDPAASDQNASEREVKENYQINEMNLQKRLSSDDRFLSDWVFICLKGDG